MPNLANTINLYCQAVGMTVRSVFNKKVGKVKGLDKIGNELKSIAMQRAEKSLGSKLDDEMVAKIDRFVTKRLTQLKGSFKLLNNPQTNKSDKRIDLIEKTETDAARWFGETMGMEARSDGVYKAWVTVDPCEDCQANEDAGPIPIEANFPSGDYTPPMHPNCPCELEYVDEDGEPLE